MSLQNTLLQGPALPFENSILGVLGPKSRKRSILTSVKAILSTPIGQLDYDPEYGSVIPTLVFEPLTTSSINLLYYYIVEDLKRNEPRIVVNSINIQKEGSRKLTIWIGYIDRNDPNEEQQQAPLLFTRQEGTFNG